MPGKSGSNAIQISRLDNLVRRLLALREPVGLPNLSELLISTLVLENDRPENYHLADTGLIAGELNIAAVAAQTSTVMLRNPAGSQTLCVVVAAWARLPAGAGVVSLHMGSEAADLPTAGNSVWRDTRRAPGSDTVGINGRLSGASLAAPLTGVNVESRALPASSVADLQSVPYILGPSRGLYLQSDAVNTQIIAGFAWYERSFETTEQGF